MQSPCKSKRIFIIPGNVQSLASVIHPRTTIEERAIYFGAETAGAFEVLLEVPLASAGELDPHTSIQITVAFDAEAPNIPVDNDPLIGIADGVNRYLFFVADLTNYPSSPPCTPYKATHDDNRVSGGPVPSQVTFLFEPFHKYGACYTAQDGGFVNTGTFNDQLDLSHGISLIVQRHNDGAETYRFYYFLVEILN